MNSIKQPTNIPTKTIRTFGTNITNYSTQQLQQLKNIKIHKQKPSLSTNLSKQFPEVSPYVEDIKDYTQERQQQSYILDDYMSWHSDINISMRESLVGWLMEIQPQLHFNHHTLYLAVIIIDKYCHSRYISKNRYHLLGISALFLAAKYQEIKTPRLKHYATICAGKYSFDQILGMESDILIALDFKILGFTIIKSLQEYCEFSGIKNENKDLCLYILDLCLIQYSFCLVKPILLSWSIVLYVIKIQKFNNPLLNQMVQQFNISKDQVTKMMNLIRLLLIRRQQIKFKNVNSKYSLNFQHLLINS